MVEKYKTKNSLQNTSIHTPIDRSHRVMTKCDVFDLIWIYVPTKKYKKLTYLKQFFIKNQLFFETRPKLKKFERRIVNSNMENSKKNQLPDWILHCEVIRVETYTMKFKHEKMKKSIFSIENACVFQLFLHDKLVG